MAYGRWRELDTDKYLTDCQGCGRRTSKQHARAHEGLCASCVGGGDRLHVCPDCGERRLTDYQKRHRYHCNSCTRNVEQTGGVYGY